MKSIKITDEDHKTIKLYAAMNGITMSDTVSLSLKEINKKVKESIYTGDNK